MLHALPEGSGAISRNAIRGPRCGRMRDWWPRIASRHTITACPGALLPSACTKLLPRHSQPSARASISTTCNSRFSICSRKRRRELRTSELAHDQRMTISSRSGHSDPDRPLRPVSTDEVAPPGRTFVLRPLRTGPPADRPARPDVRWETVVPALPDDATGTLPLVRHVVLRGDRA